MMPSARVSTAETQESKTKKMYRESFLAELTNGGIMNSRMSGNPLALIFRRERNKGVRNRF
jgi:hypothetical protein